MMERRSEMSFFGTSVEVGFTGKLVEGESYVNWRGRIFLQAGHDEISFKGLRELLDLPSLKEYEDYGIQDPQGIYNYHEIDPRSIFFAREGVVGGIETPHAPQMVAWRGLLADMSMYEEGWKRSNEDWDDEDWEGFGESVG
jgi:hypothetical protein